MEEIKRNLRKIKVNKALQIDHDETDVDENKIMIPT